MQFTPAVRALLSVCLLTMCLPAISMARAPNKQVMKKKANNLKKAKNSRNVRQMNSCKIDAQDPTKNELFFAGACRSINWVNSNLVKSGETLLLATGSHNRAKQGAQQTLVVETMAGNSRSRLVKFVSGGKRTVRRGKKSGRPKTIKAPKVACSGTYARKYGRLSESIITGRIGSTDKLEMVKESRTCNRRGQWSAWNKERRIYETATSYYICAGDAMPPSTDCVHAIANNGNDACDEAADRFSVEFGTACGVGAGAGLLLSGATAGWSFVVGSAGTYLCAELGVWRTNEFKKRCKLAHKQKLESMGGAICPDGTESGDSCTRFRVVGSVCNACEGTTNSNCECADSNGNDVKDEGGNCSAVGVSASNCDSSGSGPGETGGGTSLKVESEGY